MYRSERAWRQQCLPATQRADGKGQLLYLASGLPNTILTDFRARLLAGDAEQRIFELLIQHLSEGGWIKKRGVQRTDSTHVLAAVRRLNRVELLGETLRAALNTLAEHHPEWLGSWVPQEWFERSSRRIEEWRIPGAKDHQENVMKQIGEDGSRLLTYVWSNQAPSMVRTFSAVEGLRQTWVQQFCWEDGQIRAREP